MTFGDLIYLLAITLELLFLPILAIYIISITISWLYGAPYVVTRKDELNELVEKAKKYLTKNAQFIELGCGDGRITRMVVRDYGMKGVGYDINPLLIFVARLLTRFQRLPQALFFKKNILEVDLSQTDVIYLYLLPPIILTMKNKLLNTVKKGALIISHAFKIPYLEKYLIDQVDGVKFKTYYYNRSK